MAQVQAASTLSVPRAAVLFRLLGDESRLRLLLFLADHGEACVGDLAETVGLSPAAVSSHLTLLRVSGLVDFRREGLRNYYRLRSPLVTAWLREVCGEPSPHAEPV